MACLCSYFIVEFTRGGEMRGFKNLPKEAVYDEMGSPVGLLTIIASSRGLHGIAWDCDSAAYEDVMNGLVRSQNDKVIAQTKKQLTEYFEGKRKYFELPLVFNGTSFQQQAWKQLVKIPYGKTISYGEQAARMGDKNKARAVGMANGQNPISIVVPCHRVIGSNGHLTGFAGGLDKKAYLLALERRGK